MFPTWLVCPGQTPPSAVLPEGPELKLGELPQVLEQLPSMDDQGFALAP